MGAIVLTAKIPEKKIATFPEEKTVAQKVTGACEKTVTSAFGLFRFSNLTGRIIELATAIFAVTSGVALNFCTTFKTIGHFLGDIELLARAKDFLALTKDKAQKCLQVAGLVFLTAMQAFGLFAFITKVAEFDTKYLLGTIGNVPLFGLVGNAICFLYFSTSGINESINIRSTQAKLKLLNIKKELVEATQKGNPEKIESLKKKYEEALLSRIGKGKKFDEKMIKLNDLSKLNSDESKIEMHQKIVKKLKETDLKEDLGIASIVFCSLKVTGIVLSVIGMAAGIALLAPTSIPMIGFFLLSDSLGMYKFFYEAYHKV